MFGTPLTSIAGKSLGDKIALTAWTSLPGTYYVNGDYGIGHVAICPNFNEHAFTVFRDAYRGKGPEGIPLSDDEPGWVPSRSSSPGTFRASTRPLRSFHSAG